MNSPSVLEANQVTKHYRLRGTFWRSPKIIKALNGVSFNLFRGKTLGVVGESGCGKSTLAKVLLHIENLTSGEIRLQGKAFNPQQDRKKLQMVFQDPYSSLNPRKKIIDIIREPLVINTELTKKQSTEKIESLFKKVGMRSEWLTRYPHMLSGGQRQRVGIARALILDPEILICDEPVSALDLSIQAQVLNLLLDLQDELNLSFIFISHDLTVIEHLADEVMVMYLGKIVEFGHREKIFSEPLHPYTQALLESAPKLRKKQNHNILQGELPSPLSPPPGCAFHKRCPKALPICSQKEPSLQTQKGRQVACHLY